MDEYSKNGATDRPDRGGPLETAEVALTPPIETVFEILADEQRREICRYLLVAGTDVVTVDQIASALADSEAERRHLATNCHHRHLPKLDDAGLIEYDARSNVVRYWGQPTLEKWLEHVEYVDERPQPDP